VLTCVTLVLTALRPGLAVSLVIFSWPALAVRTGSPPVRRSASGVPGERRVSAFGVTSIWNRWPGRRLSWPLAPLRRWFLPQRASPSVSGQCRCGTAQRRGTRSAPGVSHREYLLPGHKTSAIRGTQVQLTRMNLPLPPAVVGGRRAITGHSTPVIVARQSPFSARQITRCRRIARNSALDTEDELK
jgi:hypothetical protein